MNHIQLLQQRQGLDKGLTFFKEFALNKIEETNEN